MSIKLDTLLVGFLIFIIAFRLAVLFLIAVHQCIRLTDHLLNIQVLQPFPYNYSDTGCNPVWLSVYSLCPFNMLLQPLSQNLLCQLREIICKNNAVKLIPAKPGTYRFRSANCLYTMSQGTDCIISLFMTIGIIDLL